jgi:hypothetical protein
MPKRIQGGMVLSYEPFERLDIMHLYRPEIDGDIPTYSTTYSHTTGHSARPQTWAFILLLSEGG